MAEDDWRRLLDVVYRLETAADDAVIDVAAGDPPRPVVDRLARVVADLAAAMPEPAARR